MYTCACIYVSFRCYRRLFEVYLPKSAVSALMYITNKRFATNARVQNTRKTTKQNIISNDGREVMFYCLFVYMCFGNVTFKLRQETKGLNVLSLCGKALIVYFRFNKLKLNLHLVISHAKYAKETCTICYIMVVCIISGRDNFAGE